MLVTLKKAFLGQDAGKTIDVSGADAATLLNQQIAEAAGLATISLPIPIRLAIGP